MYNPIVVIFKAVFYELIYIADLYCFHKVNNGT